MLDQSDLLLQNSQENVKGQPSFQIKKIHVDQIDFFGDEEVAFEVLLSYFSPYGYIVDLKVLRNGLLISPE